MTRENLLTIASRVDQAIGQLDLEGELVAESRFEPERILREWLEEGVLGVIVRGARLRHIDSAGLSILLGALHRFRRRGGDLILAELNPTLSAIFEVTSMQRYFKIFPTLAEAEAHLAGTIAQAPRRARKAVQ